MYKVFQNKWNIKIYVLHPWKVETFLINLKTVEIGDRWFIYQQKKMIFI